MVNALTSFPLPKGTRDFLVHQSLHGYAEGHRLLESSVPIPDDLKRLMLRMSDLSGTSVVNGFQEYLTGYPLASLGAYALAKTWYASEMSRPGCVWTHTLILPAAVTNQVKSFSLLTSLFRRPNGQFVDTAYADPIQLDSVRSSDYQDLGNDALRNIQAIIAAHYRGKVSPVIIPAKDADEFADSIFAIWSQKWPSLRTSFTFSTGSLSARTFEKQPLEIQCVPMVSIRSVVREVGGSGLGDPLLVSFESMSLPEWSKSASYDALKPEGGQLRSFLWSVADAGSPRSEFEHFVRIFDGLNRSLPLSNIIEMTSELFPKPTDGLQLKRHVFGESSGIRYFESKEIILALSTTARYTSFDSEELSFGQQAVELLTNHSSNGRVLIEALFRASLNPLGEKILERLLGAMSKEDAVAFCTDQPQFMPALVRANPRLASSAILWRLANDRKRELFESLASRDDIDQETVRGIVNAMLDSNSDVLIGNAFAKWGRSAVFQSLDWGELHESSLGEPFRFALGFRPMDVMSWAETSGERSVAFLATLAHVVAPFSDQIARSSDSSVWLRAYRSLLSDGRIGDANYLAVFLLALALCNAPPEPLDLVSACFERVHLLAEQDQLTGEAWLVLQPLVPELGWRKNWDKCERIRRALVAAFVRNAWPARELKHCIKNPDIVTQLLKSASKVGGESYFRHVWTS